MVYSMMYDMMPAVMDHFAVMNGMMHLCAGKTGQTNEYGERQ